MLFFMPRYTINQFGEASDNVFSFLTSQTVSYISQIVYIWVLL